MTSKTRGKIPGAAVDSFDYEDDYSFNLRRAAEERAKADSADCAFERGWRLEIAAIFARRAQRAGGIH